MKHTIYRGVPGFPSTFFLLCIACSCWVFPGCLFGPVSLEEEIDPLSGFQSRLFEGGMAMVYQNDVFLLDPKGGTPRQLTESPQEIKTRIALSYRKDKIAYLDQNAFPVIIDTSGAELAYLTDYGPILSLGWSADDRTLWMMGADRKEFQYYGPEMDLPDNPISPASYLNSVDVSSNNGVVFLAGGLMAVYPPEPFHTITAQVSSDFKYVDISHDGTKVLYAERLQQPDTYWHRFEVLDIETLKIKKYSFDDRLDLLNPILNENGKKII